MATNAIETVPRYGASGFEKPLRVARVQDGTTKVYWAPSQQKSTRWVEFFISEFTLSDEPYAAPTTWPVAETLLGLPKMVLWVIPTQRKKSASSAITGRGQAWWDLGLAVKADLEATYPGLVGVHVLHDNIVDGSTLAETFQRERFVMEETPLSADATSGAFLGSDVLVVFIEQDLGFSKYHANDTDFTGADVTERAGWYADDYDLLSGCWDQFRRHATWLYLDNGAIDGANEAGYFSAVNGGPGSFTDNVNFQAYCTWWESFKDDILNGTGNYTGRDLTSLGWTYQGRVDFTTAAAADFITAIETYFDL